VDADHDGCVTRAEVLKAESRGAVAIDPGCRVTGGEWVSPYDSVETVGMTNPVGGPTTEGSRGCGVAVRSG
jgi:hypothetical protein